MNRDRCLSVPVLILILAAICWWTPGLNAGEADGVDAPYSKSTYTYKVVDGLEIEADVYRAQGDEPRPAIIWIHGGALIMGSKNGISDDQLQEYLGAGFTGVSIGYPLAPETKLPGIIEDLRDAYAWIRSDGPGLFGIDPDRIAVIGHSAGGYLTLMAGFCLEPRPDALVAFYGYGDITGPWYSQPDSFYNLSPAVSEEQAFEVVGDTAITSIEWGKGAEEREPFYLYCRQQGIWPQLVAGHDPTDKNWYKAYEPIRNATSSYPPTMLLHGEKDTDVPFEQSVMMAGELERNGVAHEFIHDPEWRHSFGHHSHGDTSFRRVYDRVLAFLATHVN